MLQDAARADPVAAEQASAGAQRRFAGTRRLAELLRPDRRDADLTSLADAIWVLTGPAPCVDRVHHRGWAPAAHQSLPEALLDAVARRM